MTNSEREELEQLKRRHGELADRVHRLSRDIEALEARVHPPEPVLPLVTKPEIAAPPVIAPAPAPCLVETVLAVAPPEAVPVTSIQPRPQSPLRSQRSNHRRFRCTFPSVVRFPRRPWPGVRSNFSWEPIGWSGSGL